MFRHSDVFQMGALTFATATMSSNRTEAILNPTGMLFKMYRDHFGTIPVDVTGDSPQPKPTFQAGGDQPAVNPGSDTYPLDVSAALSEDRKTLAIAVLNRVSSIGWLLWPYAEPRAAAPVSSCWSMERERW